MSHSDGTPRASDLLSTPGRLVCEPILLGNLISAVLLEACILLRQFGVPLTDGQVDAINAVTGALLLIAAALYSRTLTAPLADPRDNLGRPLTPDAPIDTPLTDIPPTESPHTDASPPTGEDARVLPPPGVQQGDNP